MINNSTEFTEKLKEAFKSHVLMANRDCHTINELLYVLEHDSKFNGEDFNISITTLNGGWASIPSLEAFVSTRYRAMWFYDTEIKFNVEEFGEEKINCITLCEREGV